MNKWIAFPIATAALGLACANAFAQARMYKCVDAKGKTYYTQTPPTECLDRTTQELSRSGRVVKQTEVLTEAQIQAREEEKKKKAEQDRLAGEERRRNAALLNTYASEKDLEEARGRALKQVQDAMTAAEKRIAEATKLRAKFEQEKQFYAKKPMPTELKANIDTNEKVIKDQESEIEKRKKEVTAINARYDEDKRRYVEITRSSGKK
jgi:hypothetical protein